jgi:hypothetical protein
VLFTFEVRAGGSVKDFNVINVGRSTGHGYGCNTRWRGICYDDDSTKGTVKSDFRDFTDFILIPRIRSVFW